MKPAKNPVNKRSWCQLK